MSIIHPVRLDRLQQGLFECLGNALGSGVTLKWAYDEQSQEALEGNVLLMTLTGGPSPGLRQRSQGTLLLPADSVVVRVTGATLATRNIVRLNGFDYFHDTVGGDTLTTIRDALLADITAGEAYMGNITATADGADGLSLVGTGLGALRALQLLGELGNDPPVFSGDAVLVTEASVQTLVTLQAFSHTRNVREGAWDLISVAYAALRSPSGVGILTRYGLGAWGKGPISDLSAVAGAHWETRAALDVTLAVRSVFVEPVDQIDTVTVQNLIDIGGSQISESVTVVSP